MSRYDGLIIPRSYSEYINKTDAATLQQALQLSGVLSGAVAAGDNKAVTSNAVNGALANQTTYNFISLYDGGIDYNTLEPSVKSKQVTYFVYGTKNNPNINAPDNQEAINFIVTCTKFGISDTATRVKQIAYNAEGLNVIYMRTKESNGTWTSWERVMFKKDIDTHITTVDKTITWNDKSFSARLGGYMVNIPLAGTLGISGTVIGVQIIYWGNFANDNRIDVFLDGTATSLTLWSSLQNPAGRTDVRFTILNTIN